MSSDRSRPPEPENRVVYFRRRGAAAPGGPPPAADLGKYEVPKGEDNYRHRMLVNMAAFAFVAALIGAGIWLADTLAEMRHNQDCVLSGRRGCTHVEYDHNNRW